jgi:NAD(P)-dependent dehydrogenase (short-subunit alcohol dehydrogenase family)
MKAAALTLLFLGLSQKMCSPSAVADMTPFPILPGGGCVLVTDAASGPGRSLALSLAGAGIHVLAGVKSDAEIRSFAFDARKGLEPIKFDISDPATLADAVYRIKQVRWDLGRPFLGALLNAVGG